jgi:hypothetical protein
MKKLTRSSKDGWYRLSTSEDGKCFVEVYVDKLGYCRHVAYVSDIELRNEYIYRRTEEEFLGYIRAANYVTPSILLRGLKSGKYVIADDMAKRIVDVNKDPCKWTKGKDEWAKWAKGAEED